jgi:hypothetical protein
MLKENPFTKLVSKIIKDKPKLGERRLQSLEWFRRKVQTELTGKEASPLDTFKTTQKVRFNFPGQLFTFQYMPKGKSELPYFDKFPLVFVVDVLKDGFLGLNFHYIKPFDRAIIMDKMYKYLGKRNEKPVLKVTYKMLSSQAQFAAYKPCIRRYKYTQMYTNIVILEPEEWDIALFLPTEKFMSFTGGTTNKMTIWETSSKIIRKR